jgi:hypothetical protein
MVSQRVPSFDDSLVNQLSEQINYRTWRRVRDLQVHLRDGQLTVEGKAPTYYVKQLALSAICDLVGNKPLAIKIEVDHCRPVPEALAG